MISLLMYLLILLSVFLVTFILIQQGKGDMGLGSMGGGELFGGGGGQDFFEKATWTLGALFMVGALGLSIYKGEDRSSRLGGYQAPFSLDKSQTPKAPTQR